MANVELRNVTKRFGQFTATRNLNLSIDDGSFCALLGPSGCGKSTLLRMIAGLETVSEGDILIGGANVTNVHPSQREIAMVFQSYALYPHLTVADNIGFSLAVSGASKPVIAARVADIAQLLQLEELLLRKPGQLSGGQRQRVAIGRSLVRDPKVFLFDEPLSNLDAMLRVQMRLELAKLHQDIKTTMIYVTHDQVEAMTLADKVVVMDRGEISQVGAPMDLYNKPANKFVASFIGSPSMNFLSLNITGTENSEISGLLTDGRTIRLKNPSNKGVSAALGYEIGIRPEHIHICGSDTPEADFSGRVLLVERLGSVTVLHVDTPAGMVVAQGNGDLTASNGDTIGLSLDRNRTLLFGPDQKSII